MPGTYAPPAVELPNTSAIVGTPIAESSVRSWKILPAGTNSSDWVGRSAPPDSPRLITGSRVHRAAAHRGLVGDQHALDTGDDADTGDHAGADGELGAPCGQRRELEERRVAVEQQLEPLAGEQ